MDALPDAVLAELLGVLSLADCRRTEAACARMRRAREGAQAVRKRVATFDDVAVCVSARRTRNNSETAYVAHEFMFDISPAQGIFIRFYNFRIDGVGANFVVSFRCQAVPGVVEAKRRYLKVTQNTTICDWENLTEDRELASGFEMVETLTHKGREYATRPGFVYIKLRGHKRFLKVHGFNEIGMLTLDHVTKGRKHRTNESHGFHLHKPPSPGAPSTLPANVAIYRNEPESSDYDNDDDDDDDDDDEDYPDGGDY